MENDTLKMDATKTPVPKEIATLKDVPPGKVFRLAKSGTHYLKMQDGSIRNVDKAIRKLLKQRKLQIGLDKLSNLTDSVGDVQTALPKPKQENN
jgi:hypothetical protein